MFCNLKLRCLGKKTRQSELSSLNYQTYLTLKLAKTRRKRRVTAESIRWNQAKSSLERINGVFAAQTLSFCSYLLLGQSTTVCVLRKLLHFISLLANCITWSLCRRSGKKSKKTKLNCSSLSIKRCGQQKTLLLMSSRREETYFVLETQSTYVENMFMCDVQKWQMIHIFFAVGI